MSRKNTNYNGFLIISDTNWNREWFAMGLHGDFTTLATTHHTTEENAIRTMEDMIDAVRSERLKNPQSKRQADMETLLDQMPKSTAGDYLPRDARPEIEVSDSMIFNYNADEIHYEVIE